MPRRKTSKKHLKGKDRYEAEIREVQNNPLFSVAKHICAERYVTVGAFFEKTAKAIFKRAEPFIQNDEDADLLITEKAIGVEVKASDNNHNFRLPNDQLDQFLAPNFLVSNYVYALFCYKNRSTKRDKNGLRKSLLSFCKNSEQVRNVLIQQTETMYILHSDLIKAIGGSGNGTMANQLMFRNGGKKAVIVKKRFLARLCGDNATSALTSIGLDPRKWDISKLRLRVPMAETELIGLTMNIDVVRVIPRKKIKASCPLPFIRKKLIVGPKVAEAA